MVNRQFWIDLIEKAWRRRSVIWLSGVRRAGKTYLCQSLKGIEYFDCELPRVRRMMDDDPESFLESIRGKRIILDEVHRLANPSEILKIAADHYPDIFIIATGSSTLGASAKFRDTLSGRKEELWLTPMISSDLKDFGKTDWKYRFVRGGLPPFFMAEETPERDFQEWMDAYWAKDIQELFRLERRYSFQKFAELLMMQSGGIFEATRFAHPCEVSRTTITNYLSVLESTYAVNVLRPFSSRRSSEIISAPKVYAFDTGFVCYYRGWHELRQEDMGILWEHFVLNEMHARLQTRRISYWRDKRGHEIDFVLTHHKIPEQPSAIECKWSSSGFDTGQDVGNIKVFRKQYPAGNNYVVSADTDRSYTRVYDNISVTFVSLKELIRALSIL